MILIFSAGLKFLVRICSDLGLKEAQEYATKLKKAEKAKELKDQRASSGTRRGSGRGRREGSAGSGKLFLAQMMFLVGICTFSVQVTLDKKSVQGPVIQSVVSLMSSSSKC